jgi:VanZ family protein
MLPLRYPWIWLAGGWALVGAVCVGSLVPGNQLPVLFAHDKVMHGGSYFLLMTWFAGVYEVRRHLLIALVLLVLGTVLDLLQSLIATRTFSLLDVLANGMGILLGLMLARLVLAGWCQRVERLLFA